MISHYLNLTSESVSSRGSLNTDIKHRDYALENYFDTVGHMDTGGEILQSVPDFQVMIPS